MRARALTCLSAVAAVCAAAPLAITPAAATVRPHATEPTLVQGPFFGTPGPASYVIPAGVDRLAVEAGGGHGGNGGAGDTTHTGSPGTVIKGIIAVTPGQTVNMVIAAHGNDGCRSACSSAPDSTGAGGSGYGKGGSGGNSGSSIGAGGGGATSVAIGSAPPAFVAGGGGGGGATGEGLADGNTGTGPDGGDGDALGGGGGGGGSAGGLGGQGGGGGQGGSSVYPAGDGGSIAEGTGTNDGYVQLAFYEPGLEAQDDAYAMRRNTTLSVPAPGVLANDRSFGLPPKLARPARHGAVSLATDGSFTYKPAFGFVGYDTFTYVLQDADRQAIATVTILVGKVAAAALTSIGVPGQGRVLLGLACGLTARCPFDIAIIKRSNGVNRRIAHGTTTYLPKHTGVFAFRLPRSTRLTYGTGRNHVVHATLYITLHRRGHPITVVANRSITIK